MFAASLASIALGFGIGTVPFVPARYLQPIVHDATDGRVVFAEADGTIWHGAARIAFESGGRTEARRVAALPGVIAWDVVGIGFAPLQLRVRFSGNDIFGAPFVLALANNGFDVGTGRMRLPAELLEAVGAPFNTLKPGGAVALAWDRLVWGSMATQTTGAPTQSTVVLDWTNARSALSPIAPLGSYLFTARVVPNGETNFDLATREGPLVLSGAGRWTAQQGASFSGEAKAAEGREADLGPLIGMLGPVRNGAAQLRLGS